MVTVYCEHISPRIKFVFKEIFENRMGVACHLTTNLTEFIEVKEGCLINYSSIELSKGIQIVPCQILSEIDVVKKNIEIKYWDDLPAFFETKCPIGFDLPGAVFYLLSRYEEYLPFEADKHDRFPHTESINFKKGFLTRPLVDEWVVKLATMLKQSFTSFNPLKPKLEIQKTLDIDILLKYGGRGFVRNNAGLLRDFLGFNFSPLSERIKVLSGKFEDPYYNFNYQIEYGKKTGQKFIYFFQVGPYGPYDKNLSAQNPLMKKTIKKLLNSGHQIGLHPSYASGNDASKIADEKKVLEDLLENKVTSCRRHFLKFTMPATYNATIEAGFSSEHSMGYSESIGFRAATAYTFGYFDLSRNCETSLTIHPFCIMDVALEYYMKKNPFQAADEINRFKEKLANTGGTLTTVFHNESLSNQNQWKDWREVWEI